MPVYTQATPAFGGIMTAPSLSPPPPQAKPMAARRIFLQKTTKNKSFLDMHHYLKSIGIKNNAFMLTLLDPDLEGVDPHDPHLNSYFKQKILREVLSNYW